MICYAQLKNVNTDEIILKISSGFQCTVKGCPGGSVARTSDVGSGHDLTAHEFEPRVGLCTDSLEPGDCFGFGVSVSLCPSPAHALSLSGVEVIALRHKKVRNNGMI